MPWLFHSRKESISTTRSEDPSRLIAYLGDCRAVGGESHGPPGVPALLGVRAQSQAVPSTTPRFHQVAHGTGRRPHPRHTLQGFGQPWGQQPRTSSLRESRKSGAIDLGEGPRALHVGAMPVLQAPEQSCADPGASSVTTTAFFKALASVQDGITTFGTDR